MLAVIIGRRRQGKSTLAFALAKSKKQTVIVYDPNNQYEALPSVPLESIGNVMKESNGETVIRIVPEDTVGDWDTLAAELDGGCWRWGEYTLIIDEASMLMSAGKVNAALERYARTSPKDVNVILTTHRSVDIHTLFRSLASDWYIFHQHIERDLETIGDNMGVDVALAASKLPEYHVIHFWLDVGGLPRWQVWDKPSDWYIDIGRRT